MKICVIGNSHAGSLRKAWPKLGAAEPDLHLTFFAHRAGGMKNLVVRNGALTTNDKSLSDAMKFTSGGHDVIRPDDFDLFIIYGMHAKPYFRETPATFSRQVQNAIIHDTVKGTLAHSVFRKLRRITGKRIYLGHNPLIASASVLNRDTPDCYIDGMRMLNEGFYHKHNSVIIPQPADTIVNGRNTDAKYAIGSERLDIGSGNDSEKHPEGDLRHMNAEFGRLWLEAFLTRMRSDHPAPPGFLGKMLAALKSAPGLPKKEKCR